MSFKAFLLIIFIVLCGTFIYAKVASLGNPNSHFNRTTRFWLGQYQTARTVLGLHNDGDARGSYLKGTSSITIEYVESSGSHLDRQALGQFVSKVKEYTGRPVNLYYNDTISNATLTPKDLAEIAKGSRHHVIPGQPNLFIIYALDYDRPSGEVGETYQEFGIVLSDSRLKEVTKNFSGSLPQYIESTLLHEFGHQLGLAHNEEPGCIMNTKVETPAITGGFTGDYTPTSFCPYELDQLQAIKNSLK